MTITASVRTKKQLNAAAGYLELEMPEQALRELNAVDDPDVCAFEWNQLRGEALRLKQEHEAALEAFEQALAENPNDLHVGMGMAWCYKRTGRLNKAIEIMEELYQSHSHTAIVLYNLACYHTLAGNKSQALSWLGRSLRMEPKLRKLIPNESDFDGLRDDPDFQLMAGVRKDLLDHSA